MKKCNIKTPKDRLILALDVDSMDEAKELVCKLKDYVGIFKVGLQLYTSVGPEIIKFIHNEGGKIFFDGKFHDIPNTVAKANANLVKLGVTFFDIHISGGSTMIASSLKAARETASLYGMGDLTILGVTLLSSFGQRTLTEELGVKNNIEDYSTKLAKLAQEYGLNGVIANATDVPRIRQVCGDDFIITCPAVRPTWAYVNDQVRVVTPADAVKLGVDYMVIGRPITKAKDPVTAAKLILDEIEQAMNCENDEEY